MAPVHKEEIAQKQATQSEMLTLSTITFLEKKSGSKMPLEQKDKLIMHINKGDSVGAMDLAKKWKNMSSEDVAFVGVVSKINQSPEISKLHKDEMALEIAKGNIKTIRDLQEFMHSHGYKSEFDSIMESVSAVLETAKTTVDEIQRMDATISAVNSLREAAAEAADAILHGDDEKAAKLLESAGSLESEKEVSEMKEGIKKGGGTTKIVEAVIKEETGRLEKSIGRAAKLKTRNPKQSLGG